jgi:tetratricopeptide (TPR) repeat protein
VVVAAVSQALLLACASPPAPEAHPEGVPAAQPRAHPRKTPPGRRAARSSSGAEVLLDLAAEALARGDLGTAEGRFRRVLRSQPENADALVGLGRIALARGDPEAAGAFFARARAAEPGSVPALIGLSDVLRERGDVARARELLEEAVARNAGAFAAHARLAALTGRAPSLAAPPGVEAALERAAAHPYDPAALVLAGERLARAGRPEEAIPLLEKAVWLADLEPRAAARAVELLATLDEAWAGRRVVPVHVFADETVRTGPAWAFRMRTLWASTSATLDPLLATRFVPVSMRAFRTADLPTQLDGLFARLRESAAGVGAPGIVAGFTAREVPRAPGRWKEGSATFLGRQLVVRLPEGAIRSRVLGHEMLHLYGAVHVSEDVDSLMNPTGGSTVLDASNARIARALRDRHFEGGGLERDVLPWIDLDETISAYDQALEVNLHFRHSGIAEAMERRPESPRSARRRAREATELDPHLADVSVFLSRLLFLRGRRAESMMLLDLAARLYGPGSAPGRAAEAAARALERELEALYGP